jgi:hypothetical protein
MENGERRYRLVSSDGSSYIRTEASSEGGWQNSHYHKELTEIYIVQKGWFVYAELTPNNELSLKFVKEGETVIVHPLVHHNIFMSSFTITHVVKHGGGEIKVDWFPSSELDLRTKQIPESCLAAENSRAT